MKKLLQFSIFLLAFTGITVISQAQITITSADGAVQNTVGKVMTTHIDTTTKMINIGMPGQTSWDFSALHMDTTFSMTSVNPSTSPFHASDFPTSNVVFNFSGSFLGSQANIWQHFTQNSNGYLMNGMAFDITVDTLPIAISFKEVYNPASVTMKFPLTFNTQWTNAYTATSTMMMGGYPMNPTTTDYTETMVADAWGSLRLPGGGVVQALRVRHDQRSVSAGMKDRLVSYAFLTKSGPAVEVSASDTTAANSGLIQTDAVTWNDIEGSVGIAEAKPAELNSLFQNRPNPSDKLTKIQYSIAGKQFVTLRVYNFLGVEVANLVNESKIAGTYQVNFDVSQLAPGNYYYQLRAGNFSDSKKMIVYR